MRGTFESEKTLHSFAPHNVPQPHEPDSHFNMYEFFDLTDDFPISKFCDVVARIHLDSMGKAPNGFPVTTHLAYVENDDSWSDSWEEWYARACKECLSKKRNLMAQTTSSKC